MLKSADLCCRFLACRFRYLGFWHACRFLAGCLSFICNKVAWDYFQIDQRAWNAFRDYRARAATCGAEQRALDIFTLQLHALQMTKSWVGRDYERADLSGLAVLKQLHVESNSYHSRHLSSTLTTHIICTLASMRSGHTYASLMWPHSLPQRREGLYPLLCGSGFPPLQKWVWPRETTPMHAVHEDTYSQYIHTVPVAKNVQY